MYKKITLFCLMLGQMIIAQENTVKNLSNPALFEYAIQHDNNLLATQALAKITTQHDHLDATNLFNALAKCWQTKTSVHRQLLIKVPLWCALILNRFFTMETSKRIRFCLDCYSSRNGPYSGILSDMAHRELPKLIQKGRWDNLMALGIIGSLIYFSHYFNQLNRTYTEMARQIINNKNITIDTKQLTPAAHDLLRQAQTH